MADDRKDRGGFLSFDSSKGQKAAEPAAKPGPTSPWQQSAASFGMPPSTALSSDDATGQQSGPVRSSANALTMGSLFGFLTDWWPFGSNDKPSPEQIKQQEEAAKKKKQADLQSEARDKKAEAEKGRPERDKKRQELTQTVQEDNSIEYAKKTDAWNEKKKADPKNAGPAPKFEDLTEKQIERRIHGKMIDAEYLDQKDAPEKDPKEKIGKLETPEERMKFLEGFTQLDKNDPKSKDYCGPTALLAATMVKKGPEGLTPILQQWEDDAKSKGKEIKKDGYKPEDDPQVQHLKEIQSRIDKGELTNQDMSFMQKELYSKLQDLQKQINENKTANEDPDAISGETMQTFLRGNGKDSGAFRGGLLGGGKLALIDSDGDDKRNHWVLQMGGRDQEKSVYDPWVRKGGQVVRAADQVEDYRKTNAIVVDEQGNEQGKRPEDEDAEEKSRAH